jgi:cell division protein FtsN
MIMMGQRRRKNNNRFSSDLHRCLMLLSVTLVAVVLMFPTGIRSTSTLSVSSSSSFVRRQGQHRQQQERGQQQQQRRNLDDLPQADEPRQDIMEVEDNVDKDNEDKEQDKEQEQVQPQDNEQDKEQDKDNQKTTDEPSSVPSKSPSMPPTLPPTVQPPPTSSPTEKPTVQLSPTSFPTSATTSQVTNSEVDTTVGVSLPIITIDVMFSDEDSQATLDTETIEGLFAAFLDMTLRNSSYSKTFDYSHVETTFVVSELDGDDGDETRRLLSSPTPKKRRRMMTAGYSVEVDGTAYFNGDAPTEESLEQNLIVYFSSWGASILEQDFREVDLKSAKVSSIVVGEQVVVIPSLTTTDSATSSPVTNSEVDTTVGVSLPIITIDVMFSDEDSEALPDTQSIEGLFAAFLDTTLRESSYPYNFDYSHVETTFVVSELDGDDGDETRRLLSSPTPKKRRRMMTAGYSVEVDGTAYFNGDAPTEESLEQNLIVYFSSWGASILEQDFREVDLKSAKVSSIVVGEQVVVIPSLTTTDSATSSPVTNSEVDTTVGVSLPIITIDVMFSDEDSEALPDTQSIEGLFAAFLDTTLRESSYPYNFDYSHVETTFVVSELDGDDGDETRRLLSSPTPKKRRRMVTAGYTVEVDGTAYFNGDAPTEESLEQSLIVYFSFWGASILEQDFREVDLKSAKVSSIVVGEQVVVSSSNQDYQNDSGQSFGQSEETSGSDDGINWIMLVAGLTPVVLAPIVIFVGLKLHIRHKHRKAKKKDEAEKKDMSFMTASGQNGTSEGDRSSEKEGKDLQDDAHGEEDYPGKQNLMTVDVE